MCFITYLFTQTNDSAHQTMITGLAIVKQSPFLISSCKNGYMKCWDAETLSPTGSYLIFMHKCGFLTTITTP